jgi:hypothetical protein
MTAVLDTVSRTAPLGARLWDLTTDQPVVEGLELREIVSGAVASPTPRGVFVLHDVPRTAFDEFGSGNAAFWTAAESAAQTVTLEVADRLERYLPFRFEATLPTRELFAKVCRRGNAATHPVVPGVPLFSGPGRSRPAGLAAVHADVVDKATGGPAPFAVFELSAAGGPKQLGIADAAGRLALFLPYPEVPAGAGTGPLTWKLTVSVRYRPASTIVPPVPDLCKVLAQTSAKVLEREGSAAALPPQTLAHGADLVLRTQGHPHLVVTTV